MKNFLIFTKHYLSYCFWRSVDNTAQVKMVLSTLIGEYGHHYLPNPLMIIHIIAAVVWLIVAFPFYFVHVFFMKLIQMHHELNELDDLLNAASVDMILDVITKFENAIIRKHENMYEIDVLHTKTMVKHCVNEVNARKTLKKV